MSLCRGLKLSALVALILTVGGHRGTDEMKHVSALFSFCMLLRTPGHFLRLLENVRHVVDEAGART